MSQKLNTSAPIVPTDPESARRRAQIERMLRSLSRPQVRWLKWFRGGFIDRGGTESRLAELLEQESDWSEACSHWVFAIENYQAAMHERHKNPDEAAWCRKQMFKCFENVIRTAEKCGTASAVACYARLAAILEVDELRKLALSRQAGARIKHAGYARKRAEEIWHQPTWKALLKSNEEEARRLEDEAMAAEVEKARAELYQLAADESLPPEIQAMAQFKWGTMACHDKKDYVEGFRAFVAATDIRGCPFSQMIDSKAIFLAPSFAHWFKDLATEVPKRLSAADALWMMRRLAGPHIGEFVVATLADRVDDAGRDLFEGIAMTFIAQDDVIAARLLALYAVQSFPILFDVTALQERYARAAAQHAADQGHQPDTRVREIHVSDFWREFLPQIRPLAAEGDRGPSAFPIEALFVFPNTPSLVWANCAEAWKAARIGQFKLAEESYQAAIDLAIKSADPVSLPAQVSWIAEHAGLAGVASIIGYASVRVEKPINSIGDPKLRAAWLNRYCDLCSCESLRPVFQKLHADIEAIFSHLGELKSKFNDTDASYALLGVEDVRKRSRAPLVRGPENPWYKTFVQMPESLLDYRKSSRVAAGVPTRAKPGRQEQK